MVAAARTLQRTRGRVTAFPYVREAFVASVATQRHKDRCHRSRSVGTGGNVTYSLKLIVFSLNILSFAATQLGLRDRSIGTAVAATNS